MENRIRELRKAAGLRQEDLARELGVTRQTINAIENNKYDPTLGRFRIVQHLRAGSGSAAEWAQSPPACSAGRDQGYRIILPGTPLWICARAASKSFMGKRPPIT